MLPEACPWAGEGVRGSRTRVAACFSVLLFSSLPTKIRRVGNQIMQPYASGECVEQRGECVGEVKRWRNPRRTIETRNPGAANA